MASLSRVHPGATNARAARLSVLPDLLTLGLLLAVLAPVGVVFSQLPFWQRFVPPWPIFLAGALCCGLAALSPRAGWWLPVVGALGLLATAVTMYRLMPGDSLALRDAALRDHVWTWFEQVKSRERVYDDLAVTMWSTLAAWVAGMWAAWASLRAGWHWLVLSAGGVLLVSSIGYLPHWPATGLALYVVAALLFLARMHHRQLAMEATSRGVPRPSGTTTALSVHMVAVFAGSVVLVAVGWALPASHWRLPVLQRHTGSSFASGGVQFFSAGVPRTTMHDFGPTLALSGAVSLGDSPVASVQAGEPGYLFGVAYDHYNGNGWNSAAVDRTRQRAARQASVPGDAAAGRLDLRFSGESAYQDQQPVDVTVQSQQPAAVLLAAGPPLGLGSPAAGDPGAPSELTRATVRGLQGAPAGELTELVAAEPVNAGSRYTSRGLVSSASADSLRAVTGPLPDWVRTNYLQLPQSMPERVRTLAATVAGKESTDYDRALAVQTYLRRLTYDQNIPAPPPNEDGVDYLLFVTGRGYCDYFASAMAVMLRSLGIPARVVAGYVMHESGSTGIFQVRERDAHAWTEVFFAGYGWQRFDATPGGAAAFLGQNGGQGGLAGQGSLSATATPGVDSSRAPASDQSQTQPGLSTTAQKITSQLGQGLTVRTALWIIICGLVAVVAELFWVRRQKNTRRATISAWRWTSVAAGVLMRRQRAQETPAEYSRALTLDVPAAAPLQDLAALYGQARYGRPNADLAPSSSPWSQSVRGVLGLLVSKVGRRQPR